MRARSVAVPALTLTALLLVLGIAGPPAIHAGEPDGGAAKASPRLDEGRIHLMVVGDAEMVSDRFGPQSRTLGAINRLNGVAGIEFAVNASDWLRGTDGLLRLRARDEVVAAAERGGAYALSSGSMEVLRELKEATTIKVFWHRVPEALDPSKRAVAALLDAMRKVAGERLRILWPDMSRAEVLEEAVRLGIGEWNFHMEEGGVVKRATGYMSLVIEPGKARPLVLDGLSRRTAQLEYELAAALSNRGRSVGLAAWEASETANGLSVDALRSALRSAFGEDARLDINLDAPVVADLTVLVVVAPRHLEAKQAFHLEQFLLRGGRVLLLLDPVDVETIFGPGEPSSRPSGLEAWLAHVGIRVGEGVVGEFEPGAQCRIPQDRGITRYPYWPKVLPDNLDREIPFLRNLTPMPLYWPAALSVDAPKLAAAKRTVEILGTTTKSGHRRPDLASLLKPGGKAEGKELERIPLILWVHGPLQSFWKGKPPPRHPGGGSR